MTLNLCFNYLNALSYKFLLLFANYTILKILIRFKHKYVCSVYLLLKTDRNITDNIQRISYHYKKLNLAVNV